MDGAIRLKFGTLTNVCMEIPFMDLETCLDKYIINYSRLDMVLEEMRPGVQLEHILHSFCNLKKGENINLNFIAVQ